jgi:hypothetical protein
VGIHKLKKGAELTRKLRRKPTAAAPLPNISKARIRRKPGGRFPHVNYSVPDSSVYEVHGGKLHAIVTTTPRGLDLAWDNCGSCSMHIRTCKCEGGVSLPNSISYLFTKEGGVLPPRPVVVEQDRPFFMPAPRKRRNPRQWPTFQAPVTPDPAPAPKRKLKRKVVVDVVPAVPERRKLRRKAA